MREGQALGVQSVALQDPCLTQGPNTGTQNILKNIENVTGASDLTSDLFRRYLCKSARPFCPETSVRDYLLIELEARQSRSKG